MITSDQIALLRGAVAVPVAPTAEMRKAVYEAVVFDRDDPANPNELKNPATTIVAALAATPPAYAEALAAVLDGYEAMQAAD